MRALNNLKLLTKIAIPTVLLVAVTIGLVLLARSGLETLANDTHKIVTVQAARRATALQLANAVDEATIQ